MFAGDYAEARANFRSLAGHCDSLPLAVLGPHGEALGIDVAWLGDEPAERIVLVTSGVHGVEGFAGSAVQCALLRERLVLAPGAALVLVHALNPWGFAHLRRVNENNVDLNRNFLRRAEAYAGAPELYPRLDALLNPRSPPRPDAFFLRAAEKVLRYGVAGCRRAVAGGQYAFPRGLFYGGKHLQEGPAKFLDWSRARLARARHVLAFDLHSGLGRFGAQSLFAHADMTRERVNHLAGALGVRIEGGADSDDPAGYVSRGSLGGALRERIAPAALDFFTVEYGTRCGLHILYALREENRWHHHGAGTLDHPSKRRLREAFAPGSPAWRNAVLSAGVALIRNALAEAARL